MSVYDLIIIGCGGIGSATFYSATQRGLKTLCLEQYKVGHKKGGTHGETRAFRMAYYEDSQYISLLKKAYLDWKKVEKEAHQKLLVENGVLEIAEEKNKIISTAMAAAMQYGLTIEKLSAKQIRSRFPNFSASDDMIGLYQSQAGFLYVDDCVNYFVKTAQSNGGILHENEKVLSWYVDDNHLVKITTDQGKYQSKYLIVCVGGWSNNIFPDLKLPITLVQKKLVWAKVNPGLFSINNTPCFAYHLDDGIFYGFPEINHCIKVARHDDGLILKNPDENTIETESKEFLSIKEFIKNYLEQANLSDIKQVNCLYDNTPDRQFIVDYHPKYKQIAFAAGLSGHGYKMSNVLGDILIDLVTKNSTEYDISFLSMKRFT